MLRFIKKLQRKVKIKTERDINLISFYVECDKCKEKIKILVNKRNDLMDQYKQGNERGAAYILKKEVLGNDCSNLMRLYVEFDKRYNITKKNVENGHLMEKI